MGLRQVKHGFASFFAMFRGGGIFDDFSQWAFGALYFEKPSNIPKILTHDV